MIKEKNQPLITALIATGKDGKAPENAESDTEIPSDVDSPLNDQVLTVMASGARSPTKRRRNSETEEYRENIETSELVRRLMALEDRVETLETEKDDLTKEVTRLQEEVKASKEVSTKATTFAKAAQSAAGAAKAATQRLSGSQTKTTKARQAKKKPATKVGKISPSFCITAPEGSKASTIEEALAATNCGVEVRGVTTTMGGNFRVYHKGDSQDKSDPIALCLQTLGEGYSELDTGEWHKRVYYMSQATTPEDPEAIKAQLEKANGWKLTHAPQILRKREGATQSKRMTVIVRFDTKEDMDKASSEQAFGFNEVLPAGRPYKTKPRTTSHHE